MIPSSGDRELVERANILAIEHPGRIAVIGDDDPAEERRIRAAADAILLGDPDDRTGRAAGTALLYGTLPIAVDAAASRDYPGRLRPALGDRLGDPVPGTGRLRDRERHSPRHRAARRRRSLGARS